MTNPTISAEARKAIPVCLACGSKAYDVSWGGHHDWDHPTDPKCPVFSCTWSQIEGVNIAIRQAVQAAYERAAQHLDKEAASYERIGDKMEKQGKPDVAVDAYDSGALCEHQATAIRALAQEPEEVG